MYLLCQIWQDPADFAVLYCRFSMSFWLSVVLDLARSRRSTCYVCCARASKIPQTCNKSSDITYLYLYLPLFWLSVVLDLARSRRSICYVFCARPSKVVMDPVTLIVIIFKWFIMICCARSGKIPQILLSYIVDLI